MHLVMAYPKRKRNLSSENLQKAIEDVTDGKLSTIEQYQQYTMYPESQYMTIQL